MMNTKRGHWIIADKPPWFMKSEGMVALHITWFDVKWVNDKARDRKIWEKKS